MSETRYGKYIMRPSVRSTPVKQGPESIIPVVLEGLKDWGGIQHRMKWSFITQPVKLVDAPHSHDFDEILAFYGCDPAHEHEFGAEIELALGPEGENQIIDTPGVVCIPRGLVHCPVEFTRVSRPVLFCRIYVSPEYSRIPVA